MEDKTIDNAIQKKQRNKWIKIIAGILVVALILSEIIGHLLPAGNMISGTEPENLMQAEVNELIENTNELISSYEDIEYFVSKGNYGAALEKVEYIISELELSEDELLELRTVETVLSFADGDFAKAREGCAELIERGLDTNGYYSFMSAVCDVQESKFESAKEKLLISLDKGYEQTGLCYVHLAFCEYYLNNPEKLMEYSLLAEQVGVDEAYQYLLIYFKMIASVQIVQFEDTIGYASELLKTSEYEENSEVYYYKGISELSLEKYNEAYKDFKLSLDFNSDEDMVTTLHYNIGVTALALEDYETAKTSLREVVERADNEGLLEVSEELLKVLEEMEVEE